jgi:ribosome recycling factor
VFLKFYGNSPAGNSKDKITLRSRSFSVALVELNSCVLCLLFQLSVDPYDKSQMGEVEKAIVEADLGLTPTNDGTSIRINIPALTEDRRKDMLKQCKAIGEEGKVAVRNIRRDGVDSIKKLEKASDVSEDEMKDGLDAMQKMTDKYTKEIDTIITQKEKEVSKV